MNDVQQQPTTLVHRPGEPIDSDELPRGSGQAIKSAQPSKPEGDGDSPPLGHPAHGPFRPAIPPPGGALPGGSPDE